MLAELRETIDAVQSAWSKSRRGVSFPDAASCCDALPAPLLHLHRQRPPPPPPKTAVERAERTSTTLAKAPGQFEGESEAPPPPPPVPTPDASESGGDGPKARFDRATRADRVRRALPGLFSLLPVAYLQSHRSPCWQNETRIQCIPQFFVLGQVKCGTTDLYTRIVSEGWALWLPLRAGHAGLIHACTAGPMHKNNRMRSLDLGVPPLSPPRIDMRRMLIHTCHASLQCAGGGLRRHGTRTSTPR